MKKGFLIFITFFCITTAQSQVLISLIFGDKLNSEFLEFGLEGGANFSTISNMGSSALNPGFNLGFYFDLKSRKNPAWMINTGVIVKSPMGAQDIPVYSLNDENLDNTFAGGHVNREIRYFNVPILIINSKTIFTSKQDLNLVYWPKPLMSLKTKSIMTMWSTRKTLEIRFML
jgi:hypothetical protein